MMVLIICLSVVFFFLISNILQDIAVGDTGKNDQLKKLITDISGNNKKEDEISRRKIKNKELILKLLYSILTFVVAFFVTKSFLIALFLGTMGSFIPKLLSLKENEKKRAIMEQQFRDALESIMSSLKSGMSVRVSINRCCSELAKMHRYSKEKTMINEFNKMKNDIEMGKPLEEVLVNFRDSVKMEEVDDFVNSILILKSKGGNLVSVMAKVIEMISDKMTVTREIKVMTAGKKMESKIIGLIPIFVVGIIYLVSPGYMDVMFETLIGQILVVIAILLIIANFIVSRRITNINV